MTNFVDIGRDCIALVKSYAFPHEAYSWTQKASEDDATRALQRADVWWDWGVSLGAITLPGLTLQERVQNFYGLMNFRSLGYLRPEDSDFDDDFHAIYIQPLKVLPDPFVQYYRIHELMSDQLPLSIYGKHWERAFVAKDADALRQFCEAIFDKRELTLSSSTVNQLALLIEKNIHRIVPEIMMQFRNAFILNDWPLNEERLIHVANQSGNDALAKYLKDMQQKIVVVETPPAPPKKECVIL